MQIFIGGGFWMLKFQPPSAQGPPAISHRYVYVSSAASPEYKKVQRAGYYLFPICDPYILQTQMNSKPDMLLTVTSPGIWMLVKDFGLWREAFSVCNLSRAHQNQIQIQSEQLTRTFDVLVVNWI